MRVNARRMLATAAAVGALAVTAQPAAANPADTAAITAYGQIAAEDTTRLDSGADDNITCDPKPVVDGRMVNPRAPIVVGELYGSAVISGHLKCASLDTGKTYWLDGQVTDMYWYQGAYQRGESGWSSMYARGGAATVNPARYVQYPGGHPGLNTWHYAYFEGWTSTGKHITGVSPLFYVAGL